MEQKIVERAIEVISAQSLDCVLALIDLDGYPTASTILINGIHFTALRRLSYLVWSERNLALMIK